MMDMNYLNPTKMSDLSEFSKPLTVFLLALTFLAAYFLLLETFILHKLASNIRDLTITNIRDESIKVTLDNYILPFNCCCSG